MSIINSYDPDGTPVIRVSDVYPKHTRSLKACIIIFSLKTLNALIEDNLVTQLEGSGSHSVSGDYPVYLIKGTDIGVVKTTVGAPITSTLIEELQYIHSCDNFVMFGSCGGLVRTIPAAHLIVPTYAYRDEGVSYHYAPPAEYIEIKNHGVVSTLLTELAVGFTEGKVWTTDGFYRETKELCTLRRNEGCVAVEMELAACQAVADWCGCNLYNFLYRADNLDAPTWEQGVLSNLPIDVRLQHFSVAFEIAKRVTAHL